MRTNEWQETSIAIAKPSAEQSRSPPCRSSFGANAIECTRMSSRAPLLRAIAVEHRLELAGRCDVERQEDRRLELLRQRLDVRPRLVVEVGDREIGAELAERLRAAVRDRVLVGDADDERLLRPPAPGCRGHGAPSRSALRRAASRVCRAIISSSLVGITHAAVAARGRADARAALRVGRRIELDAEPGRVAADALADRRGVLADAGGEDDRVEPAERGGERAELAADAVDEQVDRQLRAAARRSPAACACRSRCPTRRAGPTAGRSASRSRARPCLRSSIR